MVQAPGGTEESLRDGGNQQRVEATQPSAIDTESEWRMAQLRELMPTVNQAIRFFGKVVDQDGQPLSGVKVSLQVRFLKESIEYFGTEKHLVESDSQGRFQLTDVEGSLLAVESLEKEGYEPSRNSVNRSFHYYTNEEMRFRPNPYEPEIFRMWKKLGAERLMRASRFYGIVPDGRRYTIDFLDDKKVEGIHDGDIIVWIERNKQPGIAVYDWAFGIEVSAGGVIETADEFLYLAPESGYQGQFLFSARSGQSEWRGRVTRNFYVKSRNGRVYTRMNVEVFSDYENQAVFKVDYFSNPNGSRVLEYDPMQEIRGP